MRPPLGTTRNYTSQACSLFPCLILKLKHGLWACFLFFKINKLGPLSFSEYYIEEKNELCIAQTCDVPDTIVVVPRLLLVRIVVPVSKSVEKP